jgi:hypothetical protein
MKEVHQAGMRDLHTRSPAGGHTGFEGAAVCPALARAREIGMMNPKSDVQIQNDVRDEPIWDSEVTITE